ncbi:unnamed protein product [Caenorhabditis auriculariae]|uniref:Protein kinase domain-containing protein n=1 Tax=Caenorhabditis auriculariae TaxID=2777116 RepID=A0A8S1H248_9PELO|nr:unnamed protein product [Caenorhabditis auriculariae]
MTHCLAYLTASSSFISTFGYPTSSPPYPKPAYMQQDERNDQPFSSSDLDYIRLLTNASQSALNNVNSLLGSQSRPYPWYPPPPTPGPAPTEPPYYDPYNGNHNSWNRDSNNSLALGLGIGIPLGVLVLCCFVVIIICCYRRRKNNISRFPLPGPATKNAYEPQLDSPSVSTYDPWALGRELLNINYSKKLGSGAFCNVFTGHITGESPVAHVYPGVRTAVLRDCPVAVKMLPAFADEIARSDFMQEINFMKSLAYHPHLVSMLGYVPDRKAPLLLVEYCEKGDLLHLIRSKRDEIIQGPSVYPNGLNIKDLLMFSWQISSGLEYLNSAGCIHRDIAARNVLVDGTNTCKIGDFGLCRLTDSLLYTARGGRLPLKWMAPESLSTYEYSFKSDVWSYGVLLWELFSLGEVPYADIQTTDLLEHLRSGQRLSQPAFCPEEIFAVMSLCWKWDAGHRPTFQEICQTLATMLESATESYGYLVPTRRERKSEPEMCDNV